MNQIWFAFITIAFLMMVGFLIHVLLELRRSTKALTEFLKTAENSIGPAFEELQKTMKSLRKVSDDINTVTEDIRLISGNARDVGQTLKRISELINEVGSETIIKTSGLRVGIKTALEVLFNNILSKKGGG